MNKQTRCENCDHKKHEESCWKVVGRFYNEAMLRDQEVYCPCPKYKKK